jgi:hypothetical protein
VKNIKLFIIVVLFTMINLSFSNLFAYETNVHEIITQNALAKSMIGSTSYLRQLGITLDTEVNYIQLKRWLELGSKLEDNDLTMRWLNHFYDPTTGKGLNTGGIIIWGEPSLQWGKNSTNGWDWENARNYYHSALRSINRDSRESAFANTFRALGQVIHLVQDIAVPAHTRNDAHNFPKKQLDMYEMYTKKDDVIKFLKYDGYSAVNNATFNSFDTFWKNNSKGLAEYTNRNFVSRNTNIDDNVYAFPSGTGTWTTTETVKDVNLGWINVEVKYLKGYTADNYRPGLSAPINRLSAFSYFDYEMEKYGYSQKVYSLNNFIHKEYSDLLIPRAVGYSAGLLDYFFRGNIEITLPDSGVYAQTNNPATGFSQLTLLARNTTPNNELMNDGTIELVVGYRRAIDDPFLNYPEDYPFQAEPDISYIVVPEKNGVRSIPRDTTVELTFDLSQKPIPLWAINVFIRVIYHGWLGNEEGSVVVGFKDISEPTPVDFFNDMDRTCLNGRFYEAGSEEAIAQVDTDSDGIPEWDIFPHDLNDIYFRTSPKDRPQYASTTNYNITVPYLQAEFYVRASYILTDYDFSYNSFQSLIVTDPKDNCWEHLSWRSALYSGIAIKNQVEYEEEPSVCAPMSAPCHIWWYPTFLTYRGVNFWWGTGIMFNNRAYPEGSECSCYQGVFRNCMSGAQALKTTSTFTGKDTLIDMLMQPLPDRERQMPADK